MLLMIQDRNLRCHLAGRLDPTITLSEISPVPMMLMKPQYEIISYGSNSNISAVVEKLSLTTEVNRAETVNSNECTSPEASQLVGFLSVLALSVTDNSEISS